MRSSATYAGTAGSASSFVTGLCSGGVLITHIANHGTLWPLLRRIKRRRDLCIAWKELHHIRFRVVGIARQESTKEFFHVLNIREFARDSSCPTMVARVDLLSNLFK